MAGCFERFETENRFDTPNVDVVNICSGQAFSLAPEVTGVDESGNEIVGYVVVVAGHVRRFETLQAAQQYFADIERRMRRCCCDCKPE